MHVSNPPSPLLPLPARSKICFYSTAVRKKSEGIIIKSRRGKRSNVLRPWKATSPAMGKGGVSRWKEGMRRSGEREEGIEEQRGVRSKERERERERRGCRGFVCIIAVIMGVSVRPV